VSLPDSEIERLIHETIDEINQQTPPNRRIAKSAESVIVGAGSPLDSLGIINFLVSLEARISASTGRSVALLNDEVLNDPDGPLRTIESIQRFIVGRI
jgi:hypothetical protein